MPMVQGHGGLKTAKCKTILLVNVQKFREIILLLLLYLWILNMIPVLSPRKVQHTAILAGRCGMPR